MLILLHICTMNIENLFRRQIVCDRHSLLDANKLCRRINWLFKLSIILIFIHTNSRCQANLWDSSLFPFAASNMFLNPLGNKLTVALWTIGQLIGIKLHYSISEFQLLFNGLINFSCIQGEWILNLFLFQWVIDDARIFIWNSTKWLLLYLTFI